MDETGEPTAAATTPKTGPNPGASESTADPTAEAIAKRIATANRRIRERDQLQGLLGEGRRQLAEAARELDTRQRAAHLEAADVEKLESFSGARMWAILRGKHEDSLRREQLEAQAAEGKVAEAKSRHDSLQADCAEVEQHLAGYADVDAELAAAGRAREAYLVASGSAEGARLTEIAAQVGNVTAELAHLDEAIAAGRQALGSLDALDDKLRTASGWSTYDTFFGGGMISTAIKHDHMDDAASLSRAADASLLAFRRELGDVGLGGVDHVLTMSEGTRFVDMWFDNIFTDMSVRNRIQTAEQNTEVARATVKAQLRALTMRRETAAQRLRALDEERRRLLS